MQAVPRGPCEHPERGPIQRQSIDASGSERISYPSRLTNSGPGSPLPTLLRERIESGIGHDFSGVRIHTNALAASATREVGAHAFTMNRDIYFGAGRYDPTSAHGVRMLAHELAHVVQQENRVVAAPRKGLVITPSDHPTEIEADSVADLVLKGAPLSGWSAGPIPAGPLVQRQEDIEGLPKPQKTEIEEASTEAEEVKHGDAPDGPLEPVPERPLADEDAQLIQTRRFSRPVISSPDAGTDGGMFVRAQRGPARQLLPCPRLSKADRSSRLILICLVRGSGSHGTRVHLSQASESRAAMGARTRQRSLVQPETSSTAHQRSRERRSTA